MLLCDEWVTAKTAVDTGFANGYVDTSKLDPKSDWFDPSILPCIPKLLDTDYGTLLNGMELMHAAKDRKKIEDVTMMEAQYLVKKWFRPDYKALIAKYMIKLKK